MTIEIKDRWTSRVLYSSDKAKNISECVLEALRSSANLRGANLSYANLRSANLSDANLIGANLSDANLSDANLIGANLRGANLIGANLIGASADQQTKGLNKFQIQPLQALLHQPGKIRAFKIVTEDWTGYQYKGLDYKIGTKVSVEEANTSEFVDCGAGINVANIAWVCEAWKEAYQPKLRIIEIEHTANDIASIPLTSAGKYRIWRGKVIREVAPAEFGLDPK